MEKVSIPVSCCKAGDILAEDVINDKGVTLVSVNTAINQYIINRLLEMEIPNVWVYHPAEMSAGRNANEKFEETKKNYRQVILSVKEIIGDLSTGCKVDYQRIVDISKMVLGGLNENNYMIRCLSDLKATDEYTYTHCVNVAFYSMLIAKWLDLPEFMIQETVQAGLMHDLGKVKIPDEILNKKGKLTEEEFEVIKKHSIYGYDLIKGVREFSESTKIAVLLHHERSDGSGYPYGISGDAIEQYARIISVADVFDAMTQDRVYKKKVTPFETFQMFLTIGISSFDTKVLNTFLKNLPSLYVGMNVVLNNGERGEIVYVPPQDITSPVIHTCSDFIDLSRENGIKLVDIV